MSELYWEQEEAAHIAEAAIEAWKKEDFRSVEGARAFIKMEADNDSTLEFLAVQKFNESLQKLVGSFVRGLK